MTRLSDNSWGKSSVRVSRKLPGGFCEAEVQILLTGDVEDAYLRGDNSAVLPTDTMRNTVYALAQEHLAGNAEAFATAIAAHFSDKGVDSASVSVAQRGWERVGDAAFLGSSAERRTARVVATRDSETVWAGINGLVVLKTTDSAFRGYPKDEYTTLPEKDDRILSTTVNCEWRYDPVPDDTTAAWNGARGVILERFFGDWSASVQHQGWLMAEAVLSAVPEIAEIEFRLPNQHHLEVDLSRLGIEDMGEVFQPVTEPYGDIRFKATRD